MIQQRVYSKRTQKDPELRKQQSIARAARRAKKDAERLALGLVCSVPGCPKPFKSYGMCNAHACKARRNNTLPPLETVNNDELCEFVKKQLGL